MRYDLTPQGGGANDAAAVQALLAKPDCTEIRLRDPHDVGFNFGDQTVIVSKAIGIRGEGQDQDGPRVRIRGGGAWLPTDAWDDPPATRSMHSGAFKVSNHGKGEVSFEDLWFSGWCGEAIFAEACDGLQVTRCRFTRPVGGRIEGFRSRDGTKDVTNVNAIFAVGPACTGAFTATENDCDLRDYATASPAHADDEQFAVCLGSQFRQIHVTDNHVWGNDDGLEVIFNNLLNDPQLHPQIHITGNTIELEQENRFDEAKWNWPGSGAIQCCRNLGATVLLKGNVIILTGDSGGGVTITGEHGPGKQLFVSHNTVHLTQHYAAFILGWNIPFWIPGRYLNEPLGPLVGATIERDNTISGVGQYGFSIQGMSAQARTTGNTVSQDRSKFGLTCTKGVFLDANTADNDVYGFYASEVQDLGTGNTIHEPHVPPGFDALRPATAPPQPHAPR